MTFEPRGEHVRFENSEDQELANRIETQRIADATRMLADLQELRKKSIEISSEGKEALALLKYKLDEYLDTK